MQETLSYLVQLQQIDSHIHELLQMQESCRSKVQELKKQLDQQNEIFSLQETLLQENQIIRQEKSLSLQKEQEKLKKWERRLMESKNSREASALSREIDAQKRLNTEAEEELLRMDVEEESRKKEVDTMRQQIEILRTDHSEELTQAEANASVFNGQITELETQRQLISAKIKHSLLNKYENIKKLRGGVAVAPVKNGNCTGCNMHLRPQLYNIILRVESLETCPSCKRILYSEEGLADGHP